MVGSATNEYARPVDRVSTTGPRVVARVLEKDTPRNTSFALPDPPRITFPVVEEA